MAEDYFAVSRQLLRSDMWLGEPFTRGQAWIDLIGLARWQDGHARIKGVRIELKRGQLCWSEVKLSSRWQWSRGKVRRFLKELESTQQIVQQKSSVTSVISLVNYSAHQPGGTACNTADGQQTDIGRTSDGTRKKKEKKEKKEKHSPESESGAIKSEATIPNKFNTPEFRLTWEMFRRWCLSEDGKVNEVRLQQQLFELARRGDVEKATSDLQLTMRSANRTGTIWDSSREPIGTSRGKSGIKSLDDAYGPAARSAS